MVGSVRTWVVAALFVSALGAARAVAQPPLVTTVVDECVPIDRQQLDRLLSIELGTSADTAGTATGPTHVRVRCVAAGIELYLQDALTSKEMTRVLSRDSFRDASSTRLLALAIAEFVVASWVELRLPQKVEPVPVLGPPPSEGARAAAETKAAERVRPAAPPERHETHTEVGAAAHAQLWSGQNEAMLGLGLRFVHSPVPPIAFAIGGDFGATSIDHAFGSVVVRTFGFSFAGLGRIELDPFVLVTGPGGRLGLAQLSASAGPEAASEPGYVPYGGVFWLARGALFLSERIALVLELELGAVTLPVRTLVDEGSMRTAVFTLDGVWLTTGLGVSFEL